MDLSSYSLSDFLLFSPEVYARLFELHNRAWWPLQIFALMLGVAVVALPFVQRAGLRRSILVLLGVAWVFVAWAFLWERYGSINWAVRYVAPAFALQGGLLILAGLLSKGGGVRFETPSGGLCMAYVIVASLAVFGYPLTGVATGRDLAGVEFFGMTADPTAAATLVMLSMARGRMLLAAFVVPAVWCLVTGLTLWVLGAATFFVAPMLAVLACALAVYTRLALR